MQGTMHKQDIEYYTLLYSEVTPTQTTVTTEQNRKFSDYDILFFIVKRGDYTRVTQILTSPLFRNGGFIPTLNEVDSLNVQRWYEVRFVSDTSAKVQSSSNATDAYVYIYGMKVV